MKITTEQIINDTDPRIRTRSGKVELPLSPEDEELLRGMLEYVRNSQDDELAQAENLKPAVGLAAIQLGIPKKMIAVVVPDPENPEQNVEYALVNPRVISESVQNSYLEGGEGCLSVPQEHPGHAFRHARVKVRGYDLVRGEQIVIAAEGFLSIVLQHEIDHLSGILFYDHIDPEDPDKEDPEAEVY